MICNAARASRPGLAVGILRVLCNGMCTAKRFHTNDEEQKCRIGCPAELDSLSHCNEVPSPLQLRHRCLEEFCSPPSKRPFVSRPHHSDPFEKPSIWNCGYGCDIGAFVYAYNRSPPCFGQSRITSGNFGGLDGRENSAYDCYHPNIRPCVPIPLPGRMPVCCFLTKGFACRVSKARYPNLPNSRTTTREKRQRFSRMGRLYRWRNSRLRG